MKTRYQMNKYLECNMNQDIILDLKVLIYDQMMLFINLINYKKKFKLIKQKLKDQKLL